MSREAGFTLVEALIALATGLAVLAAFFDAALGLRGIAAAQMGVVDVAQRGRAVTALLVREVESAGVSVGQGPALSERLPTIWPRWIGPIGEDADTVAVADRLTIVSAAGRVWVPLSGGGAGSVSPLDYTPLPHCSLNDPRCGFIPREIGLVADSRGQFDLFRIGDSSLGRVIPGGTGTRHPYDPADDTRLGAVSINQYAFDGARGQLRWSNGFSPSLPVVDEVAAFEVNYLGDRRTPVDPRPPLGVANCLFDASGNHLNAAASSQPPALVELRLAEFVDGPFCGTPPNRFDVDLLRVRAVRLRLRFQAAAEAMRGRDRRFSSVGWGLGGATVPDMEWRIDVFPRGRH